MKITNLIKNEFDRLPKKCQLIKIQYLGQKILLVTEICISETINNLFLHFGKAVDYCYEEKYTKENINIYISRNYNLYRIINEYLLKLQSSFYNIRNEPKIIGEKFFDNSEFIFVKNTCNSSFYIKYYNHFLIIGKNESNVDLLLGVHYMDLRILLKDMLFRCMIFSNCYRLHASSIVIDEDGYIFIGDKGAGKTSFGLAIIEKNRKAHILTNDSVVLKHDNSKIMLYSWPDNYRIGKGTINASKLLKSQYKHFFNGIHSKEKLNIEHYDIEKAFNKPINWKGLLKVVILVHLNFNLNYGYINEITEINQKKRLLLLNIHEFISEDNPTMTFDFPEYENFKNDIIKKIDSLAKIIKMYNIFSNGQQKDIYNQFKKIHVAVNSKKGTYSQKEF